MAMNVNLPALRCYMVDNKSSNHLYASLHTTSDRILCFFFFFSRHVDGYWKILPYHCGLKASLCIHLYIYFSVQEL